MENLVRALVTATPSTSIRSAADLRAYRAAQPAKATETATVDQAALAGSQADGMGWAFAAGYEAALARLDPVGLRGGVLAALCATEEGGGHPRAIRTVLSPAPGGFVLSGRKTWVTLGADADRLLVVASVGADSEGRNRLKVAGVPATRAGITLQAGEPTPFAPEIGHARATFDAVAVGHDELLPGDGYDDALKPFRTIEDIHVTAAVLGWAIGVGRASGWDRGWIEDALGALLLLRAAGDASPSAPETHVVLAGALRLVRRLLDAADWARGEAARIAWERDRRLLDVATSVRGARLEAAWRGLDPPR
jgi:acyl-CoA dehydrogenase